MFLSLWTQGLEAILEKKLIPAFSFGGFLSIMVGWPRSCLQKYDRGSRLQECGRDYHFTVSRKAEATPSVSNLPPKASTSSPNSSTLRRTNTQSMSLKADISDSNHKRCITRQVKQWVSFSSEPCHLPKLLSWPCDFHFHRSLQPEACYCHISSIRNP